MSAPDTETMLLPLTSRLPPSCGDESDTTSDIPALALFVITKSPPLSGLVIVMPVPAVSFVNFKSPSASDTMKSLALGELLGNVIV